MNSRLREEANSTQEFIPPDKISLGLKMVSSFSSKTDQAGRGSTIFVGSTGGATCPVSAMKAYLNHCQKSHQTALFHFQTGRPLSSRAVRSILRDLLQQKQKKELDALRTEFGDVMSDLPGKTELVEHRIETGDAKPVRLPPYRLPHAYRDIVKKELEEMEKYGIIEKSLSDRSSPIVLVKKKDRTLRFCIDFRRLNSISKTDAYPMPRVDDLLDQLGQARFISTLDLTKGYWQVPVEKTAQAKTAFRTPFGLYQFRRMPFGLQGAPSTFQRMMDSLLVGMQDFAAAYLLSISSTKRVILHP